MTDLDLYEKYCDACSMCTKFECDSCEINTALDELSVLLNK